MSKPAFYWKPSCTTCRNAKRYLDKLAIGVEAYDINKTPPSREFLEAHIDADRFLDFVSTRSPVFKTRPLPKSKKEAIDLMMEQSNLIKRPILVFGGPGSKATFGFDKASYDKSR